MAIQVYVDADRMLLRHVSWFLSGLAITRDGLTLGSQQPTELTNLLANTQFPGHIPSALDELSVFGAAVRGGYSPPPTTFETFSAVNMLLVGRPVPSDNLELVSVQPGSLIVVIKDIVKHIEDLIRALLPQVLDQPASEIARSIIADSAPFAWPGTSSGDPALGLATFGIQAVQDGLSGLHAQSVSVQEISA